MIFEKNDFFADQLVRGEYDHCEFKGCNFSNTDLSKFIFMGCVFADCNLSMVNLNNAYLKTCRFINCKLLGINFSECNDFLFSVDFDNCLLNLASFNRLKLKGAKFINCSLHETDFTEADLTNSLFDNCDLTGAIFKNSILEKSDLRSAYGFAIDPEANRIKKARFSRMEVEGLLYKYNIEIS